jgi:putative colanic acid biosynthesis glycosyltransferase
MHNPDVSIILPVKNGGRTLSACIQSILQQSVSYELIVILGPSSDDTEEILNHASSEKLQVLKDPGNGVYAAMNLGIKHSKGRWLYFIGADDQIKHPDSLKRLLSIASSEDLLLLGDVEYTEITHSAVPTIHKSSFDSGMIWRNRVHHQACLYKRRCFQDSAYREDLKILSDYDFNLKLWSECIKWKKLDEVIAICEAGGLSKNFNWGLYQEELTIKKSRLSLIPYLLNIPWVFIKFFYKKIRT